MGKVRSANVGSRDDQISPVAGSGLGMSSGRLVVQIIACRMPETATLPEFRRLRSQPKMATLSRILLLKGAALNLSIYPELGMRAMDDFDILVPLNQAPLATAALLSWGFKIRPEKPMPHSMDFTHPERGNIDLHWHALYDCAWPGADEAFWNAAQPQTLGNQPVWTLAPTDQLLHLIAHGMAWQFDVAPIRWIPDALWVLRAHQQEIDWDRLVERTIDLRLSLRVRAGLEYTATTGTFLCPPSCIAA